MNSNQIMTRTGMALIPGFLASVWVFGLGILLNVAAALLAALVLEMAYHQVRRRPQTQASLSSGLLAAVLLALCLPPMLPFGLVVFGVAFALIFGKFVYGGLGQNLFNPAMVGYGGLILSSPLLMTQWLPESGVTPSTLDLFRIKIGLQSLDGYTGATALDLLRNRQGMTLSEYWQLAKPVFNDQILISLGYLLGGIYLIQARIISFKLPLAMLIGLLVPSLFLYDAGSSSSLGSPWLHGLAGATMIGAFFIITDPVSSPNTTQGLWIYGLLIGGLTFLIRGFGAYPDGLAFAVLLSNAAAPLIDRVVQLRSERAQNR